MNRWEASGHTKVTVKCGRCAADVRIGKRLALTVKFCSQECYRSSEQRRLKPGSRLGRKNSPEHAAKIAAANRGKKRTGKALENIRRANSDPANRLRGPAHPNWRPGSAERKAKKRAVHGFLWNALGHIGKNDDLVIKELGYSPRQLADHLSGLFQPGMTWENHGRGKGKWHIDHIRPVSSFPLDTPLSIINELKNLQPLWMEENVRKGKKWPG